jgi:hypothetical protein
VPFLWKSVIMVARSQKNLANNAYNRTETKLQSGGLDD